MDGRATSFSSTEDENRLDSPVPDKEMVRTAIRLCRLGWSLIPLRRETKVPHVRWQEFQRRRSTANAVGGWLVDQFPGCNYAVITGTISGIVAIEADDEEALQLLHERFRLTPLRQRSRKGEHWIYRLPSNVGRISNRVKCKVQGKSYNLDIRGEGGYIVGPGSTHATGHLYAELETWTAEALARTPVFDPSWIDPIPLKKQRRHLTDLSCLSCLAVTACPISPDIRLRKAQHWMKTAFNGEGVCGTRQGNNASGRCYWLACRLVQGFALSPDEALPLLCAWGQREDQHDEYGAWYPWEEAELYRKLADADSSEDRDGRSRGYMLGLVHLPVDRDRLKDFVFASRL